MLRRSSSRDGAESVWSRAGDRGTLPSRRLIGMRTFTVACGFGADFDYIAIARVAVGIAAALAIATLAALLTLGARRRRRQRVAAEECSTPARPRSR
jgi:hypothetical protein